MPVAQKQSTAQEDGQYPAGDELVPIPPTIDVKIFEEINELLKKTEAYQVNDKDDIKRIDKLNKHIETAQETIAKATEKKEALLNRYHYLKNSLDSMNQRKTQSLEYWNNMGFSVRQVSGETDDFVEYEFMYHKLSKNKLVDESQNQPDYTIGIKYKDGVLSIVSQVPEIFDLKQVEDLNERLKGCVSSDGKVDYRLAMLRIKKDASKHFS